MEAVSLVGSTPIAECTDATGTCGWEVQTGAAAQS
jgi:hypothetical protein